MSLVSQSLTRYGAVLFKHHPLVGASVLYLVNFASGYVRFSYSPQFFFCVVSTFDSAPSACLFAHPVLLLSRLCELCITICLILARPYYLGNCTIFEDTTLKSDCIYHDALLLLNLLFAMNRSIYFVIYFWYSQSTISPNKKSVLDPKPNNNNNNVVAMGKQLVPSRIRFKASGLSPSRTHPPTIFTSSLHLRSRF